MKKIFALFLFPLLGISCGNAQTATSTNTDLLRCTTPSGVSSQILMRKGYETSYNKDTRLPNWVAWKLTKEHMENIDSNVYRVSFREDLSVANPVYSCEYKNTGYQRGHMCPFQDCKWNQEAANETFLMTNICPQGEELNNGKAWKSLERICREWARDGSGDLYIVTGPIVSTDCDVIGRGVVVPKAFYKVVLRYDGKRSKAFGVMYRNVGGGRIKSSIHSIDGMERLTKLDFFPALPDSIENAVESTYNVNDWQGLKEIIEGE